MIKLLIPVLSYLMTVPVGAEPLPKIPAVTYMAVVGQPITMIMEPIEVMVAEGTESMCDPLYNTLVPQVQFVRYQGPVVVKEMFGVPHGEISFTPIRSGHYFVQIKCHDGAGGLTPWRKSYEYPSYIEAFWVYATVAPASGGGFE
jgi:hypothetical protein